MTGQRHGGQGTGNGWAFAPPVPLADLTATARRLDLPPPLLWTGYAALAWERAWRGLWPLASLILAFLAVAWSGALPLLPGWLHGGVLILTAATAIVLLLRAAHAWLSPSTTDILRRLEQVNGLRHQPLSLLLDQPAADPASPHLINPLWRLARQRALGSLRRLRPPAPAPAIAPRDPWALRHLALLLALVAGVMAQGDAEGRLNDALHPHWSGRGGTAATPVLDVWVNPPAYTGLSPLFLTRHGVHAVTAPATAPAGGAVPTIPVGAVITARLAGDDGGAPPELTVNGETRRLDRTPGGWQADVKIVSGDRLAVSRGGRRLGEWPIRVVTDQPPAIAFHTPPAATERHTLRLDYTAADDYGLTAVHATIHPPAPSAASLASGRVRAEEALELDLPLEQPAPKIANGTGYFDLTASPWAGQTVTVELSATDGAGQTTRGDAVSVVLPERTFRNPVAQAVIAQRKALILAGDAARGTVAAAVLDIAAVPGGYGGEPALFMGLYAAARRLTLDHTADAVDEVVDLLWQAALRIEDGHVATAESDLRSAQNRLMDALNRKAGSAEVTQAMADLKQAMARFIGAMAGDAQAPSSPDPAAPSQMENAPGRTVDLDQMLAQLQQAAEAGDRDAARQMLSQLQSMMENVQGDGDDASPGQEEQNRQARQTLERLTQLTARQRALMDETFRQTHRAAAPPAGENADGAADGLPPGGEDAAREPSPPAAPLTALARRQDALRQELDALLGKTGDGAPPSASSAPSGPPPAGKADGDTQPLAPARQAMGAAAAALAVPDAGSAVEAQGQALAALEQGMRDLAQQMAQRRQGRSGTRLVPRQAGGGVPPGGDGDPLGRALPGQGGGGADEVRLPTRPDIKRVREILDELRRRANDGTRPQEERDYIERLLDKL